MVLICICVSEIAETGTTCLLELTIAVGSLYSYAGDTKDMQQLEDAMYEAIKLGYRVSLTLLRTHVCITHHPIQSQIMKTLCLRLAQAIDTAELYGTEPEVGRAVARAVKASSSLQLITH